MLWQVLSEEKQRTDLLMVAGSSNASDQEVYTDQDGRLGESQ